MSHTVRIEKTAVDSSRRYSRAFSGYTHTCIDLLSTRYSRICRVETVFMACMLAVTCNYIARWRGSLAPSVKRAAAEAYLLFTNESSLLAEITWNQTFGQHVGQLLLSNEI